MRFAQQPENILKEIGIHEPEDIDLDLVSFHLNAEVRRAGLNDCEGHILGTAEKALITINDNTDPRRQRFSLGHELGHWVNDRGKNLTYRCTTDDMRRRWGSTYSLRERIEARANSFSARLLMPDHILPRFQDGLDVTAGSIDRLASIFNVSRTSMAIRFVETSQLPCMLVCWSKNGSRRWFARNSIVPEHIWPHKKILNTTATFIQSNGQEVDADKWISTDSATDFSIIESVFTNGFDMLTLIWWKDEDQLLQ